MHNAQVIRILSEVADLLDIKGDNPFRIRAFRNAVELLENFPVDLRQHLADGHALDELPGIGKGLAKDISQILERGDCDVHRDLLKEYPASLLSLLRVPGVGPKKARRLFDELGVKTLDDLEAACRAGKAAALSGFGAKSEEKILKGIFHAQSVTGRFLLDEAREMAEALLAHMRGVKGVARAEIAGSLRRGKETVGDLDILVAGKESARATAMKAFLAYDRIEETIGHGEKKASVRLKEGIQADLRFLKEDEFGAAWQYFTGSKEHNVALRARAQKMGMKVSEYGVFKEKDEKRIASKTEEDVYESLGLAWIPPELRENRGELDAAEKGTLPRLIEEKDLRGDLHNHTVETDGAGSIEEMAEAAQRRGLEYLAITDHSKAVTVARGMDEKRLLKHLAAIRRAREKFPKLHLLAGVEVDILKDGSLDLRDDALEACGFVVASVHSFMAMGETEMTKRVIRAMQNPHVDAVGHPTGRLIKGREGYTVSLRDVAQTAKETGTFLELNAHPMRLDLNDAALREAVSHGAKIVINTDSHNVNGFENARYGVLAARRGWLTAGDVVNTLPWEKFRKALAGRKGKSAPELR